MKMRYVLLVILSLLAGRSASAQSPTPPRRPVLRWLSDTLSYDYFTGFKQAEFVVDSGNYDLTWGTSTVFVLDFNCDGFEWYARVAPRNYHGHYSADTMTLLFQTGPYNQPRSGRYTFKLALAQQSGMGSPATVGYATFKNKVYVQGGLSVPPPATITPAYARPGQTLDVTITAPDSLIGLGYTTVFDQGSSTMLLDLSRDETWVPGWEPDHGRFQVNSFIVTGPTTATANISIPPDAPLGRHLWATTTSSNACLTMPEGFHITDSVPGSTAGRIAGRVYADLNSDCQPDASEPARAGVIVRAQGDTAAYYAFTNDQGQYSIPVPPGRYTVQPLSSPTRLLHLCTASRTVTLHDTALWFDHQDFGDSALQDFAVWAGSGPQRPGRNFNVSVGGFNWGDVDSDTRLVLAYDSLMTYVPSPADTAHVDSVATTRRLVFFKPGIVAPLGSVSHFVTFSLPFDGSIRGLYTHLSAYRTGPPDQNIHNDTASFASQITGSYDPNDITVDHTEVEPGFNKALNYVVRFQNTGTDTAFYVMVTDTLSPLLDVSTIGDFASSHPVYLSLKNGKILEARFPLINLPDSGLSEPASHGFLSYSIRPLAGLQPGQRILNTASVYFDYNAPVLTNTAITSVYVITAATKPLSHAAWFPNPTTGLARIAVKNERPEVRVCDLAGRPVSVKTSVADGVLTLDASVLAPGLYLVRLSRGAAPQRLLISR